MQTDQTTTPAPSEVDVPPDIEAPTHTIDRGIYAMPSFATIASSDLAATRRWFAAIGFVQLAVMGDPAAPMLVHVRRYRYQDVLVVPAGGGERSGPAATRAGGPRLSFSHAGPLGELDEIAERCRATGLGDVSGPAPTPWHSIDLELTGPDGATIVLTARSPEPASPELDRMVRDSIVADHD